MSWDGFIGNAVLELFPEKGSYTNVLERAKTVCKQSGRSSTVLQTVYERINGF